MSGWYVYKVVIDSMCTVVSEMRAIYVQCNANVQCCPNAMPLNAKIQEKGKLISSPPFISSSLHSHHITNFNALSRARQGHSIQARKLLTS